MDKTENYHSTKKQKFNRQISTENRGSVYDTIVCFPSVDVLDVEEAFKTGIFDENSKLITVENKKNRRKRMEKKVSELTDNFQVAGCEAYNLKLNRYLKGNDKVDCMMFDICGNMTAQLAGWFFKNQKHFKDGMRMSLTLKAINRWPTVQNAINAATDGKYTKTVMKALKHSDVVGTGFLSITPEMRNSIASQIYLLINSLTDKKIDIHGIYLYANTDKDRMSSYMIVLDTYVYDADNDVRKENNLNRVINKYNANICDAYMVNLYPKVKKVKIKSKTIKTPRQSNIPVRIIDRFDSIDDISSQHWAHITMKAKKEGKNPVMVKAGIKAAFKRAGK